MRNISTLIFKLNNANSRACSTAFAIHPHPDHPLSATSIPYCDAIKMFSNISSVFEAHCSIRQFVSFEWDRCHVAATSQSAQHLQLIVYLHYEYLNVWFYQTFNRRSTHLR